MASSSSISAATAMPPPNADLATAWAFLEESIDRAMTTLQTDLLGSKYMALYTVMYNYCTVSQVQHVNDLASLKKRSELCAASRLLRDLRTAPPSRRNERRRTTIRSPGPTSESESTLSRARLASRRAFVGQGPLGGGSGVDSELVLNLQDAPVASCSLQPARKICSPSAQHTRRRTACRGPRHWHAMHGTPAHPSSVPFREPQQRVSLVHDGSWHDRGIRRSHLFLAHFFSFVLQLVDPSRGHVASLPYECATWERRCTAGEQLTPPHKQATF